MSLKNKIIILNIYFTYQSSTIMCLLFLIFHTCTSHISGVHLYYMILSNLDRGNLKFHTTRPDQFEKNLII